MAKPPEPGKAVYSIFTSPHHAPQPDHLPTLMVTPAGRPQHILYIFMHTNYNCENYLLTPSEAGDLCVAKLFPPPPEGNSSGSSSGHGSNAAKGVRCEASRNLRWTITNTGVAMPTYKLTLPNPDGVGEDQPLIQISKTNRLAPYWTMTYYTYAGHLIPPRREAFGRIEKTSTEKGGDGGTRVIITGKTDAEKAVWKTLGEGNEDMVEWCVLCGALNVLDDEIREAAKAAGHPIRPPPTSYSNGTSRDPRQQQSSSSQQRKPAHTLHPTGRSMEGALAGLKIHDAHRPSSAMPGGDRPRPPQPRKSPSFDSRPPASPGPEPTYRSTSPYRPPPSPTGRPIQDGRSGGRPPQVPPNEFYQMPPPTLQDSRRPERSQPAPTARPSQPSRNGTAESRVDPRMDGRGYAPSLNGAYAPAPNGSYDPRKDPRRDPRAPSPSRHPQDDRSRHPPDDRSRRPQDDRPRYPQDDRTQASARAPPPASLRTTAPPANSSSRSLPFPGSSSSKSPSSPPRGPPATGRERTIPSNNAPRGPHHERTSSLEQAARSIGRQPSPVPGEGRRQAGREAVQGSYAPTASRRFGNEPLSPTFDQPPGLSRGVQLQDVPASRVDPASSVKPSEGGMTGVFSAAEKIKQQRLSPQALGRHETPFPSKRRCLLLESKFSARGLLASIAPKLGVRGLISYLRRDVPDAFANIELDITQQTRLVVDGHALAHHIYLLVDAGLLGGELITYRRTVLQFVEAWKRMRFDVTVVFDGLANPSKRPRRLKRMHGRLGEVDRYLTAYATDPATTLRTPRIKVCSMGEVCRQAMLDEGVDVYDADEESDGVIAYLSNEREAYIVSCDTDFAFMNAPRSRGLLLLDDMLYSGDSLIPNHYSSYISATVITRSSLARTLRLFCDEDNLAYLAYLAGNDISGADARGLAFALQTMRQDGMLPEDRAAKARAFYELPRFISPISRHEWDRDLRMIAQEGVYISIPLFEDPKRETGVSTCTSHLRRCLYAILAETGEMKRSAVVEYTQAVRLKVTEKIVEVPSLASLLPGIEIDLRRVDEEGRIEVLSAILGGCATEDDDEQPIIRLVLHYLTHLPASLLEATASQAVRSSLFSPTSSNTTPSLYDISLCAQLAHTLETARWLAQALRLGPRWTRPVLWEGNSFAAALQACCDATTSDDSSAVMLSWRWAFLALVLPSCRQGDVLTATHPSATTSERGKGIEGVSLFRFYPVQWPLWSRPAA